MPRKAQPAPTPPSADPPAAPPSLDEAIAGADRPGDATRSDAAATPEAETLTAWHYEAAVAEVEEILAQIEGGELELAALFDRFETAVQRLRQCEAFLNQKQQQMDLLIETLEPDF
ncbi:MAG: exodeoxyribonuclease VII small subunit [Prochlorothrix sp.]|nr:exodeoxyribonuclease VII small subunit [Prochlorothrix sp.]